MERPRPKRYDRADVESTVTITRRGEQRLRAGHPWIYRSDVRDDGAPGGTVVRVVSQKGRLLGRAICERSL
jgi:23S rRNA (cytosine1962-C5)-methyltransferase